MSEAQDRVWLLVINHRHGEDEFLHRTEEGAKNHLLEFVKNFWGELSERGHLTDEEREQWEHLAEEEVEYPLMPADRDAAISFYFEHMADGFDREDYSLEFREIGD